MILNMRPSRACFALVSAFLFLILTYATLVQRSHARQTSVSTQQAAFEKREAAYRANNIGVALLEQYKAKEAVESFRHALAIKPDLLLAQINLSIALYYLPDATGAKVAAEKALAQEANAPQPHYILGLIARAENRFDDAIAEFQKVLKIDPSDVGSNINTGQIFVQQRKYNEAIVAFRKAIEAEPYNETALYNLGLLLTRTGKKEEGQKLIRKFQQFQATGAGTTIGTNYLEGGHYAEAVVSTGLEADLVDRATPDVKFVDVSSDSLLPHRKKDVGNPRDREGKAARESTSFWGSWEEGVRNAFAQNYRSGVTLFDFDNDGQLDLLELTDSSLRLWHNNNGRFVDVTSSAGDLNETISAVPIVAVAGDYDNDGRIDLLVVRYGRLSLYHNDGNGKFSDRTKEAGIPDYPYLAISAAFVDVDHDGDLDIFIAGFADLRKLKAEPALGNDSPLLQKGYAPAVAGDPFAAAQNLPGAPNLLLRNNGNGTFTDITAQAKVTGSLAHAVAVVPTDYDNRRDVDLLVLNYEASPNLFRNQRDGSFRDVTHEADLDVEGKWTCVAAGDLNKDGFTDFFFGRADGPGLFALSDGKLHFKTVAAPGGAGGATVAQFLDYDNDGLLDLVTVSTTGVRVRRNVGDSWVDVSGPTIKRSFESMVAGHGVLEGRSLASGDLTNHGHTDLVMRNWIDDSLMILRNEGGNLNRSTKFNLHGRVSNKSAVEAKIELRAGSLYQKLETYAASPAPASADIIFGLGKREKADAVRVIWPAGIVQSETEFQSFEKGRAPFISLNITELDRKPSSCPYLYAWSGERFEFITDFMGGGEMGYLETPGHYNKPDPDEYVRIGKDQLKEKEGRYELRVTNELEEALFVDRMQLLSVAHPAGTEVYPNEGMSDPPKPFKLFVTKDAHPPLSAVDDHGNDVLDRLAYLDRRYPDDFKLDGIRGYAQEHTLTMKLTGSAGVPPASTRATRDRRGNDSTTTGVSATGGRDARAPSKNRILLLLTGWTDYAWSSDNVAASQARKTMKPPSLQVKDRERNWRTVIEDIGIPVGRPQTVTVDLTGKFLSSSREVRIVTNMRIYWDQILVDTSSEEFPTKITRLDPVRADLRWRGFSAEVTPDGREPFGYDYERVSFSSPWKVMTGRYTREGDVRALLLKSDDMFVICRPGDEISLSFDATALPPLPAGWTRTFLLYADGFSKEMDVNSASPDQLAPLPFHGMSQYPYHWPAHNPLTEERRAYIERYNTRVVSSTMASIEAELLR
jgi:tetratricopeptide (TPR) repeat protein